MRHKTYLLCSGAILFLYLLYAAFYVGTSTQHERVVHSFLGGYLVPRLTSRMAYEIFVLTQKSSSGICSETIGSLVSSHDALLRENENSINVLQERISSVVNLGCNIDEPIDNGIRSLHFAVLAKNIELATMLLALGSNSNLVVSNKASPYFGLSPLAYSKRLYGKSNKFIELFENTKDVDHEI